MLGQKIREQRKIKGLTQKELAEKSKVSLSAIEKYEKGTRIPSLGVLVEIGKVLETPLVGLKMALLKNKEDAIIDNLLQHYIDLYQLNIDIKLQYTGDCRISELKRNISEIVSETLIKINKEDEC